MTTWPDEAADPDVLGVHDEHALLRGTPWRRFAVLGDSIAEGVGDPVDGYLTLDWSRRVARGLRSHRPSLAYRNLGVRGLRAADVRERQLEEALRWAPDLAAVCAGGSTDHHPMLVPHGPWLLLGNPNQPDGLRLIHRDKIPAGIDPHIQQRRPPTLADLGLEHDHPGHDHADARAGPDAA
jgi:hypothetical protein